MSIKTLIIGVSQNTNTIGQMQANNGLNPSDYYHHVA